MANLPSCKKNPDKYVENNQSYETFYRDFNFCRKPINIYLHAKFKINTLENKKVIKLLELWQFWLKKRKE